jgi:tetratricopeptide (TPR) repeat protein
MSGTKISKLSSEDAVARIIDTVKMADPGEAPFALVLGSGFSQGLVPTAKELVETSLPLWMKSRRDKVPFADLLLGSASDTRIIAQAYWQDFAERNKKQDLNLKVNAKGMPEIYSDAYQAAFDPKYSGAVGTPADARKFQRELMRLDQPRLNAAHFLLASLLGVQPGKGRQSVSFQSKAAFSRLILTTNFDPFLQIALQAVNRLYFMSDTPDLGVSDEVLDDQSDAIHLVYVHGSIHRKLQAATNGSIDTLKRKNAQILGQVLKRHGVIVLGYSGWDDAIVEALANCDQFDHRLYWCGREADPERAGAFGERVPEILRKESACYVQIGGAGDFLAKVFGGLVDGRPRLLENPIQQVREMLEIIDLSELESLGKSLPGSDVGLARESQKNVYVEARNSTLSRLAKAEELFLKIGDSSVEVESSGGLALGVDRKSDTSRFEQLVSSAGVSSSLGKHADAIDLLSQALNTPNLGPVESAIALLDRAYSLYSDGKLEQAVTDLTTVLNLAGAPVEQVAAALFNRGLVYGKQGQLEKEVEDYTRLIDGLAGAPVEQVAAALFNRGVAYGKQGEAGKELEDYTRVIDDLTGAPVEQVARALVNRGVEYRQQGEAGKALEDYTRVIDGLAGAPVERVAKALGNRGWCFYQQGKFAEFLSDSEEALRRFEDLAFVSFNLGLALLSVGRDVDAMAAYQKAAEKYPKEIEEHGLSDLKNAEEKWLSPQRAKPIIELLQSKLNAIQ